MFFLWCFFILPPSFGAPEPDLFLNGPLLAKNVAEWWAEQDFPKKPALDGGPRSLHLESILFSVSPFFPTQDSNALNLERWILKQPVNSIYPDQVIKKAIHLCNGDILAGLKICWDSIFSYQSSPDTRNFSLLLSRFVDITGEHESFDGNFFFEPRAFLGTKLTNTIRGDKYSALYHLFGSAIFSYYYASRYPRPLYKGFYFFARSAIRFFELFDHHIDKHKRRLLDKGGFDFGEELARLTKWKKSPRRQDSPSTVNNEHPDYLQVRPDLYGNSWRLKPGQAARYYGRKQYPLSTEPTLPQVMESLRKTSTDNLIRQIKNDLKISSGKPLSNKEYAAILLLADRTEPTTFSFLQQLAQDEKTKRTAIIALGLQFILLAPSDYNDTWETWLLNRIDDSDPNVRFIVARAIKMASMASVELPNHLVVKADAILQKNSQFWETYVNAMSIANSLALGSIGSCALVILRVFAN